MSGLSSPWTIEPLKGGVLAAAGFVANGVAAGIKRPGKLDVCLIDAGRPVPAAAVFTRNAMAAAPVLWSREAVRNGTLRAWVVNSGNANACTGASGDADAQRMAQLAAEILGCEPTHVGVASTGVIGAPLPMASIEYGITNAARSLGSGHEHARRTAEAIMTTDTFPKEFACRVEAAGNSYTVGGMAKGSGMIMPNMATMLAFLTTDAPLDREACRRALARAVEGTFNRITVDGETSTNDTAALLASGAAPRGCARSSARSRAGRADTDVVTPDHVAFEPISAAVERVCAELARAIVRDGEGATKLVAVNVRNALSVEDAEAVARAIANSPLFKTAIFGRDANWGRVAMALGNSGATIDPGKVHIVFAGITTCSEGAAVPFDEEAAFEALGASEVEIVVDLRVGSHSATYLTCDLTYEYVRINGAYRT